MLKVGQAAPYFEAESTKGLVRLSDYAGRSNLIMIFYPKDNTPTCTKQLCAARDAEEQYVKYGAEVLAVNPGSLESHTRFANRFHYNFPILYDKTNAIRKQFDVGSVLGLFTDRTVYIIDKTGVIRYARRGNPPTQEILSVLAKIDESDE